MQTSTPKKTTPRKNKTHFEFGWHTPDKYRLKIYAQGWKPQGEIKAAVCLIHGIGEHSDNYAELAGALNKAGFAVVAFDLRGHGKSGGVRGDIPSYKTYMDDIEHFLKKGKKLFPNKPVFLYGHSMGGNLVLNFALRRKPKITGVIATGPALLIPPPPPMKMFLGYILRVVWPSFRMKTDIDNDLTSRNKVLVEHHRKDPLGHKFVSVRMFFGFFEAGFWALKHASEFPLPLLLMHGGADKITNPEGSKQFAKKIEHGCTFKIWPGLYHCIHEEPERKEVFDFIIKWLNKTLKGQKN